jgi:HTH-type transcriptional regulator, sugar sensing transcriptional regulator
MAAKEKNLAIFDSEPGSHLYEHRIRLEKIRDELLKFGLTSNQAKVYIYLGKSGPKTAPEVFKTLGFPRTETYYILNTLQNRGIVTSDLSSPLRYSALPLEQTFSTLLDAEKEKLKVLSEQTKEISALWEQVPGFAVETAENTSEKLQMIQGQPQIFSKLGNMINSYNEEILIFGSVKDLSRLYHSNILDSLPNSILDVKIIISPANTMPAFAEKIDKKRIRLLPESKQDNQCFVIKDHDEIVIFLRNAIYPSNDIFAMWSDSKALVDSMHTLFDYSWNDGEVCH